MPRLHRGGLPEVLFLLAVALCPAAAAGQPAAAAPPRAPVTIAFEVTATPLGRPLEGFREETLTVSPDGKRVAYVAGQVGRFNIPSPGPPPPLPIAAEAGKGRVHVVVDGAAGFAFGWVTLPVFSADGRRVAYSAGIGPRTTVIIDGEEGKPCKRVAPCVSIGAPVFSPDGRHIGYVERRHKMWTSGPQFRMARDDEEGHDYDYIGRPVFSPDSEHVAYLVREEKDRYLVIDAKETPAAKADEVSEPRFSPDGRRIAYAVRRGKQFVVVLDGQPGAEYDQVGLPRFHLDGRLTHAARRGKTAILVTEGAAPEEHSEYSQIGDPVLAADGKHVAYWAYGGGKERVVLDGSAGKAYDELGWIGFGPDSRHLAFEARLGSQWRLVVDGVEGPEYGRVKGLPVEREWRDLVHRNDWIFEGPDALSYVGVRDGELVRWRVKIAPVAPAP
jgi:dipeptidyl aminopeptidase/acylaminoacyl peptidase